MTHRENNRTFESLAEVLIENGFEGMAEVMSALFNEAMKLERATYLGAAPYERTDERRGYANGFKPKRVKSRLGDLDLRIPQVRESNPEEAGFYPKSLEKGLRSERALKLAVAEMYVQGVSTRKVKEITQELCGLDVSSTQVSRAAQALDEELESWRNRPLGEVPYLILDARYEKVRHGGSVIDCAVLLAIGVLAEGRRSLLGVSVSLSEAEAHWRSFLESLQDRGMHGTRYVVSDSHQGLRAALSARMSGVRWQRCQFHLQQNATAYIPNVAMRKEVAAAIRSVFNAPDIHEANRRLQESVKMFEPRAPKLVEWMEENIPEGLAVFDLPSEHRIRMRTTNSLEMLNKQIKKRTRVAGLFPNEASLLRLVSALLSEVSEDWETGKPYLNMRRV